MATAAQKRVNLAVSRVIPPVLLGVIVYASYAITKPLCSELRTSPPTSMRIAPLTRRSSRLPYPSQILL
jgi:palmitoyltransferase